jgi:AraC-like DNA-binding protein
MARLRAVSVDRQGADEVTLSMPIKGTALTCRVGSTAVDARPGDPVAVARPFESHGITAKDARVVTFCVSLDALTERAERLTLGAARVSGASQLTERVDFRTPFGRGLERIMKAAIAEIVMLDSSGLAPVALDGYEDLLVSHAAAALFPMVSSYFGRPGAQVAPATVHRVRDYLRSHASETIEISRLAADANIPIRTLQDNFHRHFGLSPQAWQRQCRLENARQSLMLPDEMTTVSAVAEKCGFGNFGDFSVQYRQEYGEPPSKTLRAARGRLS